MTGSGQWKEKKEKLEERSVSGSPKSVWGEGLQNEMVEDGTVICQSARCQKICAFILTGDEIPKQA